MEKNLKKQKLVIIATALLCCLNAWADEPKTPASSPALTAKKADTVKWLIRPGSETTRTIGSLDPASGYKFQVDFSAQGASVSSVKLADYFETVADKQLFDRLKKDQNEYAKLAAENPKKYEGHYTVVKTVDYRGSEYQPFESMALKVYIGKDEKLIEIAPTLLRHKNWREVKSDNPEEVVFEWEIWRQTADAGQVKREKVFSLFKTYKAVKDSYSIEMSLRMVNHCGEKLQVQLDQAGPVGLQREGYRADERTAVIAKWIDDKIQPVILTMKELNKAEYGKIELKGKSEAPEEPVVWLGSANKFFASMMYLMPLEEGKLNAAGIPAEYFMTPVQATKEDRMWLPTIKFGKISLSAAGAKEAEKTVTFNLFVGPKDRSLFQEVPLYAKLRYVDSIASGSCAWCTFDWLMVGLMWLLKFFANTLFFGNFGLAIMLLVLIVRIILHPLTKKGQVSMAKMQKNMSAMQPQIKKIKEKYGDDKKALNAEMMKIYKDKGNPMTNMLGCLPMLLQMPIWVALYSGLNTSVELRHAAFLPFWITDLAAPDQLLTWSKDLPLIGHSLNLLPILLTVAMFLQQKLSPHASKEASTPEQAQQQKMMLLMMPIMMLFFFYTAPSGLTLYIMASTTIGVIEQQRIRAHIKEKEEQEAARETVIDISGRGPRDNRPKKPKGPLWTKRG